MARPIDRGKEQFWRQMIARWTGSGLSIAAFCADADLAEQSFYRWRRVLRERRGGSGQQRGPRAVARGNGPVAAAAAGPVPLFVPLAVEAAPAAAVLEVVVHGGCVVRVPVGFDAQTLSQLLALLEGRPC